MTRVLISGVHGRMGRLAATAIAATDDLEFVGGVGRGEDLAQAIQDLRADVVLDFTTAEVVRDQVWAILNAGATPVIGTSGLDAGELARLEAHCRASARAAAVIPNFAIGAVLLMRLCDQAAALFPEMEIIESHHAAKKDAPSGTARATALRLERVRSRSGAAPRAVPIHSVRLPGLIAEQHVVFGHEGETLSITHRTYDRRSFAAGILLACRRVKSLQGLVVGLDAFLSIAPGDSLR